MIEKLNNLLKKGSWENAQDWVEDNCDFVEVHTERNTSYSQDWRKTVKTSHKYYLLDNYLVGHQIKTWSYGSNERISFEFDLIS
jgi:hypothetical protein